uniref:dolichyl-P-Man:Man5GlcNAc2-PP-dolichol alpha-1,3-mannosyltransferase n=1 Tax=Schistosoma haematobium TaxID=6185 RepID=A0A095B152_SCHHA
MILRSAVGFLHGLLYKPYGFWVLSPVFIILEILCGFIIIDKVPYTEIDWVAYMQQVSGFINGTLDYDKLEGQTGPCVLGVSVKMNILLFLPGFLIVLVWHKGILETIGHLCECFIVQLAVGTPFLFHNAWAYVSSAFNFGRQFMYIWTVNWRFLPETIFHYHLCSSRGGMKNYFCIFDPERDSKLDPAAVLYPMFVCNFVGIVISRSLHYQFYVWYFHTIPYLLWCVRRFSTPVNWKVDRLEAVI